MSDNYRSQLIGSTVPMPPGEEPQGMWKNIVDINLKMAEVNANVWYESFYVSRKFYITRSTTNMYIAWYEWPVMWKGVMYHWESLPGGKHECVYLFGNPLLFWTVLLSSVIGLFYGDHIAYINLRGNESVELQTQRNIRNVLLFVLGYFANILPYPLLISRPCYMYHYHPSLVFGVLLTGCLLDILSRQQKTVFYFVVVVLITAVVSSYIHFLPFSYALPLTDAEHEARRWFKFIFPHW